jgi:alkaline phosphatase D
MSQKCHRFAVFGLRHRTLVLSREAIRRLLGNVSLVNNYTAPGPRSQANQANQDRYAFSEWKVSGAAFSVEPEQRFGPILWLMYTLSDSRGDEGFVLKLSALTGPLGPEDSDQIELQVADGEAWRPLGTAKLDSDAQIGPPFLPWHCHQARFIQSTLFGGHGILLLS